MWFVKIGSQLELGSGVNGGGEEEEEEAQQRERDELLGEGGRTNEEGEKKGVERNYKNAPLLFCFCPKLFDTRHR